MVSPHKICQPRDLSRWVVLETLLQQQRRSSTGLYCICQKVLCVMVTPLYTSPGVATWMISTTKKVLSEYVLETVCPFNERAPYRHVSRLLLQQWYPISLVARRSLQHPSHGPIKGSCYCSNVSNTTHLERSLFTVSHAYGVGCGRFSFSSSPSLETGKSRLERTYQLSPNPHSKLQLWRVKAASFTKGQLVAKLMAKQSKDSPFLHQ